MRLVCSQTKSVNTWGSSPQKILCSPNFVAPRQICFKHTAKTCLPKNVLPKSSNLAAGLSQTQLDVSLFLEHSWSALRRDSLFIACWENLSGEDSCNRRITLKLNHVFRQIETLAEGGKPRPAAQRRCWIPVLKRLYRI